MEAKQTSVDIKQKTSLLATVLVAAIFLVVLLRLFQVTLGINAANWQIPLLIALATLSTLSAQARQLQWQYVLAVAGIIAVVGGGALALSLESGIPFGPFDFGPAAGPKLFNCLPWTIPLIWIVVLINSRGVSRLILRPWRKTKTYGFWLIGVTVGLVGLFDLGMDPFLVHLQRFWFWRPTKFPVNWQGAPLTNVLGWIVVSLLIFAFATPMLIKKQPGQKSHPDYHPLGMWIGALGLFAVAAGMHGLWVPLALDVVAVVGATIFAIRGGRW
jgi:uncharacterized membrane protein